MQIVIDISEEMINLIKDKSVECFNIVHYSQILDAIYNGTPIPNNATNGDVIKMMFPSIKLEHDDGAFVFYKDFDSELAHNFFRDWWNALYQKGGKE